MSVVRYEPWNLFRKFDDDMNRLFNEVGFSRAAGNDDSNVVTSHWSPAVDIKEEPDRFVLMADIPGVDPKDIEITMEKGVLTIKGERRWRNQEEKQGYKRTERVHGTFYRRFSLPDGVDPEGISAKGNNGVLEVVIAKQEKVLPRRIKVDG